VAAPVEFSRSHTTASPSPLSPFSSTPCSADGTTPVYIKFNPVLHGAIKAESKETTPRLLNLDFIRKFIHHVKETRPKLTDKSRGAIVLAYNDFRQRTSGRATLITARSLETIVRLSSAHAKLRLSSTVKISDVRVAVDIMNYALYGDSGLLEAPVAVQESAPPVTPGPRPGAGGRPDSDDEDGGDAPPRPGASRRAGSKAGKKAEESQAAAEEEEEERAQLGQKRSAAQSGAGAKKARSESSVLAKAVTAAAAAASESAGAGEEEEVGGVDSAAAYEAFRGPAAADAASLRTFKEALTKHFKGAEDGAVTIAQLPEVLKAGLGARYAADVGRQTWVFSHLKALEADDKVLVSEGIIHFV